MSEYNINNNFRIIYEESCLIIYDVEYDTTMNLSLDEAHELLKILLEGLKP
jgi:hypothetical protein